MVAACVRADTASLKKDIDSIVDKLNNQGKTVERLEQRIVRDRVASMQARDNLHRRRELLFQRMDQVCELEKKLQLATERVGLSPCTGYPLCPLGSHFLSITRFLSPCDTWQRRQRD